MNASAITNTNPGGILQSGSDGRGFAGWAAPSRFCRGHNHEREHRDGKDHAQQIRRQPETEPRDNVVAVAGWSGQARHAEVGGHARRRPGFCKAEIGGNAASIRRAGVFLGTAVQGVTFEPSAGSYRAKAPHPRICLACSAVGAPQVRRITGSRWPRSLSDALT